MIKAKFTKTTGKRFELRIYWGEGCSALGCHDARKHVKDITGTDTPWDACGDTEDYPTEMWPTHCDKCGQPVPVDGKKQVFSSHLWDTPSGKLEPGCLFWVDYLPINMYWDNHVGPHLYAMLPNGHEWNIDSRASNCGSPNDRTHRCWRRHGDPETGNVHVDKNGETCSAGAGSIQSGNYHGFLNNGEFTD